MYKDDKKYHMDLKENARGRFLKVSETFTRGYSRFQVRSQVKKKLIPFSEASQIVNLFRCSFQPRGWTSSSKTWAS